MCLSASLRRPSIFARLVSDSSFLSRSPALVPVLISSQDNFCRSLTAYSIVMWLLLLRDRHNGNLMLDDKVVPRPHSATLPPTIPDRYRRESPPVSQLCTIFCSTHSPVTAKLAPGLIRATSSTSTLASYSATQLASKSAVSSSAPTSS